MVLRPDGTKAELFYKGSEGQYINRQGRETADGKIVFIESDKNKSMAGECDFN